MNPPPADVVPAEPMECVTVGAWCFVLVLWRGSRALRLRRQVAAMVYVTRCTGLGPFGPGVVVTGRPGPVPPIAVLPARPAPATPTPAPPRKHR